MPTAASRPRRLASIVGTLVAELALALASPTAARAQPTVSGEAFGVTASWLLVTVTEFPDVVLAPEGGSASAAVAGLNVVGLLTTGAIAVDTSGTTAPSASEHTTAPPPHRRRATCRRRHARPRSRSPSSAALLAPLSRPKGWQPPYHVPLRPERTCGRSLAATRSELARRPPRRARRVGVRRAGGRRGGDIRAAMRPCAWCPRAVRSRGSAAPPHRPPARRPPAACARASSSPPRETAPTWRNTDRQLSNVSDEAAAPRRGGGLGTVVGALGL